jgi:hypothetical protein
VTIKPTNCKHCLHTNWTRPRPSAVVTQSNLKKSCRVPRGLFSPNPTRFCEGYRGAAVLTIGKMDSRETVNWNPVQHLNDTLPQRLLDATQVFALRTPVRHAFPQLRVCPARYADPGALHDGISTTLTTGPAAFERQAQSHCASH